MNISTQGIGKQSLWTATRNPVQFLPLNNSCSFLPAHWQFCVLQWRGLRWINQLKSKLYCGQKCWGDINVLLASFHLPQLHLQDPPYKLGANIKTPEGFHRILNPPWERRVSSSIFSLSSDALKTWGLWQKLNWGVAKEQLHGHSNPCAGFESPIKWIIRYIFSLSWCPSAPSLSPSDYHSSTPQEQQILLSSLHPFDCSRSFLAPLGAGSQGRDPGEPHRGQGQTLGQLWGQGEMNQRTDRVIPGIPSALEVFLAEEHPLLSSGKDRFFREPSPANTPWSAAMLLD